MVLTYRCFLPKLLISNILITYTTFLEYLRDVVVTAKKLLNLRIFNVFCNFLGAPVFINGTFRRLKPDFGPSPDDQISRALSGYRNKIIIHVQSHFTVGKLSSGSSLITKTYCVYSIS